MYCKLLVLVYPEWERQRQVMVLKGYRAKRAGVSPSISHSSNKTSD